jgi:RNA polymerase sigma-70 factor (ECF subfamily)
MTRTTDPTARSVDLERLYRQHRRTLLSFVRRHVRNDEDAEDVVQCTFLEAHRCAHQFEGTAKASTWLFGIAHNLARNRVRQQYAREAPCDLDEVVDLLAAPHADPGVQVEQRQLVRKALNMLLDLSPAMQDTLEAVFETSETYSEAAVLLGVPIGTVRSRLNRIRSHLRVLRGCPD